MLLPPQKLRRLPGPFASATAKSDILRRGGVLCGVTVIMHVANVNRHAQVVASDQLLGDLALGFYGGFGLPFSVTLQDKPWGVRG